MFFSAITNKIIEEKRIKREQENSKLKERIHKELREFGVFTGIGYFDLHDKGYKCFIEPKVSFDNNTDFIKCEIEDIHKRCIKYDIRKVLPHFDDKEIKNLMDFLESEVNIITNKSKIPCFIEWQTYNRDDLIVELQIKNKMSEVIARLKYDVFYFHNLIFKSELEDDRLLAFRTLYKEIMEHIDNHKEEIEQRMTVFEVL